MAGWQTPPTFTGTDGTVVHDSTFQKLSDDLNALNGFVRKTADESVTSSAVLQNDNELSIAIPAAGTYEIDVHLIVTSAANAAGDVRVGATFPAGTMTMMLDALDDATLASGFVGSIKRFTAAITSGVDPAVGFGASTSQTYAHVKFLFVATASGTFQFQWAQAASNANATTVKANSFLTMVQRA
jgi:hypothetical protein